MPKLYRFRVFLRRLRRKDKSVHWHLCDWGHTHVEGEGQRSSLSCCTSPNRIEEFASHNRFSWEGNSSELNTPLTSLFTSEQQNISLFVCSHPFSASLLLLAQTVLSAFLPSLRQEVGPTWRKHFDHLCHNAMPVVENRDIHWELLVFLRPLLSLLVH